MSLRFGLLGKTIFIVCTVILATLMIIGAIARADDEPPLPLPPGAIGVDMSTSSNNQGLIQYYNLELFGPQSCTRFGDPFTPLFSDAAGTIPNPWYSEMNGAYTYRIAIPPDYQASHDQVRVELFDPQTGNSPSLPTKICQSDDDECTTTIPACRSPSQTEPCLLSTIIGGTNTDIANPYYFARIDETRHSCSEPVGNPYNVWRQFNTRTLFRLYYYRPVAGGGVEPVDLAYYIGKKDDPDQTTLVYPFGMWQAAQTGADSQTEALATMLTWVSPGAPASERMPAYTEGDSINGVLTQRGSPEEPATVTEDCDATRTLQLPFATPNPFSRVTVGSSQPCVGNGDFIVNLGSEASDMVSDPGTGMRYLYLDVRGIDGESENNFSIWAGPAIGEDPAAAAPAEANARQLYILRQQAAGNTLHGSEGLAEYGVGHLPLNLDVGGTHGRFPIADLGPEYAGVTLTVDVFDADFPYIPDPPLIFYMDSISQNDWEACFSRDGADDCVTDLGGDPSFYLGTETLGYATNNVWGHYTFTLPGAADFTAGHLMAYYNGALLDTSGWKITVAPPAAPVLVSPLDGAPFERTPVYSWLAPTGGVAYQFQYDNDPNFDTPTYTSGEIAGLSVTPPSQAVGTYSWRVRARNPVYNWGVWSEARTVTIVPTRPPSDLTATAVSRTQINLAWMDNSSVEDGYRIERAPAESGSWVVVDTTAADATTYSDTTVSCGTRYDYRVTATSTGGDSDPSNTASDTTDACPQPAVSLSETLLDFGIVAVGQTSSPLSVTLTNPGNALLTVGSLGITGDFALTPAGDSCSGQTIPPNGICSFSVTFSPTLAGLRTGEVSIPSDAPGQPHSVSLRGNGQPLPPALCSPRNGAAVYTRRPKLAWKAVTGASLYHVQIDDNDDFLSPVPGSDADVPSLTFTPPSALPFGTYYWRVRAQVDGVWSEYSMPYTFDVTLHRLPRKNAAIYPRRPKFTWLKVKNAVLPYRIEIWDGEGCTSGSPLARTSRKPTYTLARKEALDLGTYSWRVSADGGQTWTPCWRFDVTNLKTPKSWGAVYTTKPRFTWAGNAAATGGYELTVSLHPDDGSPDVVKIDGQPTKKPGYTATANDGLDFGRYLWRVEECIGTCDGVGDTTPDRGLYITNMVAPKNDLFTLKGKITFTWKKVTGASTYELVVSEDPDDFEPRAFNAPATSALKRVSPALPRGTYFWHIVTSNGKTMPTWTFTVGP